MDTTAFQQTPEGFQLVTRLLSLGTEVADDSDDALAVVADDIVLHVISGVPGLGGDRVGKAEYIGYFAHLVEQLDELETTPVNIATSDSFDVVLSTSRGKKGEVSTSWSTCLVLRVEDGRYQEAWLMSSSVSDERVAQLFGVVAGQ